jgi:large subunit ribosomal protein L21
MYAVIKSGGKQHKVEAGDVIEVEYMDVDPGSAVEFEPILVRDDGGKTHVGKGLGRGKARVLATLVGDTKDAKIKVFKYRPKSGYQRTQGHRQRKTVLEIQEIALGDTVIKKADGKAKEAPAEKKPAAKKPAAKKRGAKKPAAKKSGAKKAAGKKSASKKAAGKKSASKKPPPEKKPPS